MYLKAVRMRGFKSFAAGVELRFDEGIAVVVGPNGSGKSNIADALQWAMAVQSPAQLRAPTGQDVLFGGSDSRPPAGVCEVELVLDNECGTLPIEFNEVSVMRRLYRDGESEYHLNRAKVRRLDVLELLSDTGLGREMHSVIGQGKVEEILLSKPHERRRFVEEAAGLGKYQRRRTRAEQKLARVASELERARDLEREVRARLRPLAMQATAAERAAKLGAEIAQGRVELLSSELLGERRRATDLRDRLASATRLQAEVAKEAATVAGRREKAEQELAGLSAEQERAARAFYAFESSRERLAAEAGRMAAALARLDRGAERRRAEAEELSRAVRRSHTEADAAEALVAELEKEAASIGDADVEAAAQAAAQSEAALAAALDARRGHADAEGQAANVRRDLESGIARSSELGERLEALVASAATSRSELQAAEAQSTELAARLAAAAAAVASAGDGCSAAEQRVEELRVVLRDARARADEAAAAEQLARTRLLALETAVDRGEGLSPAARALQDAGARLVVAGVEAAPGFERAVAAALGWRAGAVVVERVEDAIAMLDEGEGELGVILAGRTAAAGGSKGRPLAEVCTVHDPSLSALIDGVRLVDDLRGVTSGVAVTAWGSGIDADRGELWRTADAAEAAWMAARTERDRVRDGIAALESESGAARTAAEAAEAALTEALAGESSLRAALTKARDEESEATRAERAAALRRDQLADELARCDAARDLAESDLESEAARLIELRSTAAGFDAVLAERRAAATAADEQHAALDATRRRLAEQAARAAARLAAIGERLERHRADAARSRADAERSAGLAARLLSSAEEAAAIAPPAQRVIAALGEAAERAVQLAAPARSGIDEIERRAGELAGALQACATEQAALDARAQTATGAVTEIEIGLARCDERVTEIERRRGELATAHEIEVAEPERPLEVDEAAARAARLERLERRRESLGAVNPLAQEEYEQEKQRGDDLTTQCDDLERSLKELRTLIRDLTRTIDQRFEQTFHAVAKYFSDVIETLFPGGRGRLRLTEAEPAAEPVADGADGEQEPREAAEPGIELEVRPAGKRIESLSLLSGGEKSLTAIAFLFSLLLTKPSPFYLLDEVEAALDDANIERFLTLLRTYQDKAQFIVITHQRRTMEVADVLYGVSMAEDGQSKVLSRRMPSEPDLHEAALESA